VRFDAAGDFFAVRVLGKFEIEVRLKIGPELGRCFELASQA
jgi:hypothetical protein